MKIKLYLTSIIVWGVLTSTVFAQVNVDEMKPQPPEDIVVPEGMTEFTQEENDFVNNLPSTEMTDLTLNKEDYQLGETIKGSFKIRNERDYSIPNLQNTITLTKTNGDDNVPLSAIDIHQVENVSLAPFEVKKIDFEYILPKHIAGEYFGVRVAVLTDLGSQLSWDDAKVSIKGISTKEYAVQNAFIQVEDKQILLQEGPIIKEDRPAYLHIDVVNPYEDDRDVSLVTSIYEKGIGGDIVKKYKKQIVLKTGLNKDISFIIQIEDDLPSIYDGTVTIEDATYTPTAQVTVFHYIVDGPMVNIHSVEYDGFDVDDFSLQKGDDFSLILNYSGEIADFIDNVEVRDVYSNTEINLTDDAGVNIATWNDVINYNQGLSKKIDLVSGADANIVNVNVSVFDSAGDVIAEYTDIIIGDEKINELQQVSQATGDGYLRWMMIFIVTIPFIVISVAWLLRKNHFFIFILFLLPMLSILSVYDVDARAATRTGGWYSHWGFGTLTVNTPPSKVCAGDEFDITGTATRYMCNNASGKTNVTANGYGSWSTGWLGGDNKWHTTNFTISNGRFIAPSEPGSYSINFIMDHWLREWDPGSDGRSTWRINYEVESCEPECTGTVPTEASLCPGSDIDLTEDFEWRRAENDNCSNESKCEYYFRTDGVCNSNATGEYELDDTAFHDILCASGTPSPVSIEFPEYGEEASWDCIGTGGGNSTENRECKANRKKPESQCGTSSEINGGVMVNSSADITDACATENQLQGSVTFNTTNGRWEWDCAHDYYVDNGTASSNLASPSCSAPSCLAGDTIQYNSNVYLKEDLNDQTTNVSVVCNDPTVDICCDIDSIDPSSNDTVTTHVCTDNADKEIFVSSGINSYPAECYIDDGCEATNTCPKVDKPLIISTMCAQKECNAQGSCQATPKAAASSTECSSTCNSNADCSSGRIIETRP